MLSRDLRYVLRSLLGAPRFTLGVVLSLALGIGASTAIVCAVDQAVLRKPFPHYDRLVLFGADSPSFGFIGNSYPSQVLPCQAAGRSFEAFALNAWGRGTLGTGTETLGVNFSRVNPEFFPMLGRRAGLGRLFTPADFQPGAEPVMVLSPDAWAGRFGKDPRILGRSVELDGRPYTLVGVVAPGRWKRFPMEGEVIVPLRLEADPATPFRPVLAAVARLRPGSSLAQANAEVAVLGAAPEAPARFRERFRDHPVHLKPLGETEPGSQFGRIHGVFLGAMAFLFAIASFNAMNLMLVRMAARGREVAIRFALGATRLAILKLLGLETLVLCLASGGLGLLLAGVLTPAILAVFSHPVPGLERAAHLDARTFVLALAFSLATSLLLVSVLGWRLSRLDPQGSLKEGGPALGEGAGLRRLREGLVVLGAAMALVLLTGTGLLTRSVHHLMNLDRGFATAGKVAVWVDLPRPLQGADQRIPLARRLEERLQGLPGLRGVSASNTVPLAGTSSMELRKPDGSTVVVGPHPVSPAFMAGLGLRLLRGRWLPERPQGAAKVLVLNATMAKAWFGDEEALGRRIEVEAGDPWEVIGVVADVRNQGRRRPGPEFYHPYGQDVGRSDVLTLLLDCAPRPGAALLQAVRRAIHDVEPLAGVRPPVILEEAAREEMAPERLMLGLLQLISAVALALAALGLFSLMAYAASRRMGEFGVRMALGATPRQIFHLLLRRGLQLSAVGVAVGLACSWALTRFLASLLFETSPLDPWVHLAVAALLMAVGALACWIPARSAARAEPAGLMRSE